VHSFGISCLGIRIDCIPGRINPVYELVKLNGKIRGFCYESCGQYHSNMVILGFSFVLLS
jgi:heme/copper-type cytochrome/quinol oxidase subunit 2